MGLHRNPILDGCHPDPSICRIGEEYFLVTSTFEYLPGLPIHRSTDLVNWELIGHAIERGDQIDLSEVPASGGLFAPTIRHHDGRFFVVCTLVGGTGQEGNFIVTASDPAGPWSDPIWLDALPGIDPSLTFDGDRVWLCGTSRAEPSGWEGHTDVWLTELDPISLLPIGERSTLWSGALRGARWAEGPHILPRPGGGWMLLSAEGGTEREHAIVVAYADEITGPYVGDPGNPRLTHRDLGSRTSIVGVGHADLVDTPDGHTWAVMLATHTIDGVSSLLGRQTHVVPVEWEDARPLFAPGAGRVEATVEVPGVLLGPVDSALRDDFDDPALSLHWNTPRRMPSEAADLTARPGFVRLAGGGEPREVSASAFLGRRLPHARVLVRASCEAVGDGVRGGILLRTSDAAHVEISVSGASAAGAAEVRAVLIDGGEASLVGRAAVPAGAVELGLRVDGWQASVEAGGAVFAEFDVTPLASDIAGGFVGSWVGPFAAGEGHVDVDWVEIQQL